MGDRGREGGYDDMTRDKTACNVKHIPYSNDVDSCPVSVHLSVTVCDFASADFMGTPNNPLAD